MLTQEQAAKFLEEFVVKIREGKVRVNAFEMSIETISEDIPGEIVPKKRPGKEQYYSITFEER